MRHQFYKLCHQDQRQWPFHSYTYQIGRKLEIPSKTNTHKFNKGPSELTDNSDLFWVKPKQGGYIHFHLQHNHLKKKIWLDEFISYDYYRRQFIY